MRAEVNGNAATLTLGTVVKNEGKQPETAKVKWQILDAAGKTVAAAEAPAQAVAADGSTTFCCQRKAAQSCALVG